MIKRKRKEGKKEKEECGAGGRAVLGECTRLVEANSVPELIKMSTSSKRHELDGGGVAT